MRQTLRQALMCRLKPSPLLGVRRRQEQEWGGRSLQELQRPHKSRLLREQEEWAERVCDGPAHEKALPALLCCRGFGC